MSVCLGLQAHQQSGQTKQAGKELLGWMSEWRMMWGCTVLMGWDMLVDWLESFRGLEMFG